MSRRLSIPGPRALAASLDEANGDSVVVACPPHPRHGGDRHDGRLTAVGERLVDAGVDCLRFDYGPWDGGDAEQSDVGQALSWARDRYDYVGLYGYSFGASMALLAGADGDGPDALSVLAPAAGVHEGVVDAVAAIRCPAQVVYGERDDTADWEPVVERARGLGYAVESLPADHFFVGQQPKAAGVVVEFLVGHLDE